MFDEKIAQSTQMTYSEDDTKKAKWGKTVCNYWIGRTWEMRQLLPWAANARLATRRCLDHVLPPGLRPDLHIV